MNRYDEFGEKKAIGVLIIGGGILGTTVAYWLSTFFRGEDIVVLERENDVALHSSSRNTGVVHRPFYLDPKKKKILAKCANVSYELWKKYAKIKKFSWLQVGTLEVATDISQIGVLKKYINWASMNGMKKNETRLLTSQQVRKLEPSVRSSGALLCKTDTIVSFKDMTESLKNDSVSNGVRFLMNEEVVKVDESEQDIDVNCKSGRLLKTKYLINCAGGNSLKIANLLGIAKNFSAVNIRGEYWSIIQTKFRLTKHNIYSIPGSLSFSFLDPHWTRKIDGSVEVGPNAVPVFGPFSYKGLAAKISDILDVLLKYPFMNAFRLYSSSAFLKLAVREWISSVSKRITANRIKKFMPLISVSDLIRKKTSGIRTYIINEDGQLLSDVINFQSKRSFHVLNYNSPGATCAPAYSSLVIKKIMEKNGFRHMAKKGKKSFWDFEKIIKDLRINKR
jgi:(S)-2-hydroxyglutarate dehydrogenase